MESVRFTPDGRFLLIHSSESFRWWRLSDFHARSCPCSAVCWSLGATCLFQIVDSVLLVTDLEMGRVAQTQLDTDGRIARQVLSGQDCLALHLTSDRGSCVACWSAASPTPAWVWNWPGSIEDLAFLKDGSLVITAREAGTIKPRLIRLGRDGQERFVVGYTRSGFVLAEGAYLSVRSGNVMDVFSLDTGHYLHTLRGGSAIEVAGRGLLVGWLPVGEIMHGGRPGIRPCQALSPDRGRLLVCHDDGKTAVVTLATGEVEWVGVNMLAGAFDSGGRALILAHNGQLHAGV